MADRSELHLPLFNNRYIVLVPQYAAQQASGRFLPGEHITTGNRELDNRAAMQLSNLNLPIINTAYHSPSILKLHEQGTKYRFETPYNLLDATKHLKAYLDASLDYHGSHPEMLVGEVLDDLSRLGSLADAFSKILSDSGFVQQTHSVMSVIDQMLNKPNADMRVMASSRYETFIKQMRRNSGL